MHFAEGGYNRIAVKLFNCLDVDTFYVRAPASFCPSHLVIVTPLLQLEYDTIRAGDFTPLKHLPLNKVAVLGLVTTKTPRVRFIHPAPSFRLLRYRSLKV